MPALFFVLSTFPPSSDFIGNSAHVWISIFLRNRAKMCTVLLGFFMVVSSDLLSGIFIVCLVKSRGNAGQGHCCALFAFAILLRMRCRRFGNSTVCESRRIIIMSFQANTNEFPLCSMRDHLIVIGLRQSDSLSCHGTSKHLQLQDELALIRSSTC